ncbi:hypothetical protein DFH28DRAFT_910443 [Melampsora americana]|nr:hypothetical protein DFH28DRAFT_910443 [Melampsora americana]
MPRRRQVDDFKPNAKMVFEAVALLKHLKKVDLPLKDLLLTLFLGFDDKDELAISRRYLSIKRGWPSTFNILMAIKKAVHKKEYGLAYIQPTYFHILQALKIVAKEGSRRRLGELSEANHANQISHKFFDVHRSASRYAALRSATGFLWHLIRGSIARSRGIDFEDKDSYLSDSEDSAAGERDNVSFDPADPVISTGQSSKETPCSNAHLQRSNSMNSLQDSVLSDASDSTVSHKDSEEDSLPPGIEVATSGGSEGSDWADEEAGVVYVDGIDRKERWKNRAISVRLPLGIDVRKAAD